MTNTKAQVGDLIRIVNPFEDSEDKYSIGDILEVARRRFDGDGSDLIALYEGEEVIVADREYVIHRKAGDEHYAELHAGESVVPTQSDAVNSPNHYTQGRVEVIDIIEDAVQGADPFEAVCQANILKYTLRYRAKNGVEDLKKAQWYLAKLIAHEQRKIDGK